MATTRRDRVGRVRERLAALISEATGCTVRPEDLSSQIPHYASPKWDCCSWDGEGTNSLGLPVHYSSWDTMTECVRNGIDVTKEDAFQYEIHARETQP
jgi:hypothetical protein